MAEHPGHPRQVRTASLSISLEVSKVCVDRFAAEIVWGAGGSVTAKIVIPAWRGVYLSITRPSSTSNSPDSAPAPEKTRTLGVHVYRGALRWSLLARPHDWGGELPRWRHGYVAWRQQGH